MPDVPTAQRPHGPSVACASALVGIMLVGGLAGCDPADPAPPPSPPPVSSPTPAASTPAPTPTPSPTPSPTSQKEQEEAAIKQAVLDYNDVLAEISLDPEADIEQLKSVARGPLLQSQLGAYREWRAKGWRATKAIEIENVTIGTITAEGGQKIATASYCADTTGVDVVDRNGESQVEPGHALISIVVTLVKSPEWLPSRERTGGDACRAL